MSARGEVKVTDVVMETLLSCQGVKKSNRACNYNNNDAKKNNYYWLTEKDNLTARAART